MPHFKLPLLLIYSINNELKSHNIFFFIIRTAIFVNVDLPVFCDNAIPNHVITLNLKIHFCSLFNPRQAPHQNHLSNHRV